MLDSLNVLPSGRVIAVPARPLSACCHKKAPILGKRIGVFSLCYCPGAILAVFLSSLRGAHARQLLLNCGSRPQLIKYHLYIKLGTVTDIAPRLTDRWIQSSFT